FGPVVNLRRRTVQLSQLELVYTEIAPAPVHPGPEVVHCVLLGGGPAAHFRRDVKVASLRAQSTQQPLAAPVPVVVRGVEEINAPIQRGMQRGQAGVLVVLTPTAAHRPGTQADRVDMDPGFSERSHAGVISISEAAGALNSSVNVN